MNGKLKMIDFQNSDFWKLLRPPLIQFSKFNNFLWVRWFLGKNLSNFIPPVWKLHNPYCHKWWCSYLHKLFETFSLSLENLNLNLMTNLTLLLTWLECMKIVLKNHWVVFHCFFEVLVLLVWVQCLLICLLCSWALGGFQLLDLILPELKIHMTC